MWWSTLKWIIFGVALIMLGDNFCNAAPSPRNDEMFRELMKLDQLYSSIARPRRSLPSNMSPEDQEKLLEVIQKLEEFDRKYAIHRRPRFGKRGEHQELPMNNNAEYDNNQIQYREDQDGPVGEWLPLRR